VLPQRRLTTPWNRTAANAGQLIETSKRFGRQLLTIGDHRFEVLMEEMQEERKRLPYAILLALGVAAFGLRAGPSLAGAILGVLWALSRVARLLGDGLSPSSLAECKVEAPK
jgi:hypothetical protein